MTQFALAKAGRQHSGLKSIFELEDEFLRGAAIDLFPGVSLNEIYFLDVGGKDIDSLMLDAQKAVNDKKCFRETELYKAIEMVSDSVDELVFWYSSDYDDLDYVYDVPELLRKLEGAVSDSFCEVYGRYRKSK